MNATGEIFISPHTRLPACYVLRLAIGSFAPLEDDVGLAGRLRLAKRPRSDCRSSYDVPVLRLVGIGVVAGVFSALFGVGGGIVAVPLLVLVAGFPERGGDRRRRWARSGSQRWAGATFFAIAGGRGDRARGPRRDPGGRRARSWAPLSSSE